jgi:short-subunit dehydrogenase
VKSVLETSWEDGERLLLLDLHTPLRLTQIVLKGMVKRKAGTIVDIASMAAIGPTPGMFFYNAAKAGLAAASEGLRAEMKPHGIHVVTVYPGPVTSDMEAAARSAYENTAGAKYTPTGSPEVLARLIAKAVEKKRPRVVYPSVYGISRHLPNVTRWAIDALTPKLKALAP